MTSPASDGSEALKGKSVFSRRESGVRTYSRNWPVVFDRASGTHLYAHDGRAYLDFFAGAGALNYGHNNPLVKAELIEYLKRDGVTHSLDMWTLARDEFLEELEQIILRPRGLDYTVAFPGPAGTNAVEAALKLARRFTGKKWVVSFNDAFHGMTQGALSVNGNDSVRGTAGVPMPYTMSIPFDDGATPFALAEAQLADSPSGLDGIAAVIVETVQGEGGMNAARDSWLRELSSVCAHHKILLIVDDVQMGCGRVGSFFSFEYAGIVPDMVCMSKGISGYGLPMALLLIRPDLDVWVPGEHNGTFRGFNPAFVTATATMRTYWRSSEFQASVEEKVNLMRRGLERIASCWPNVTLRGRGLARGLRTHDGDFASRVRTAAFERGLLVETCGPLGEVIKLIPPLTVAHSEILSALEVVEESIGLTSHKYG